MSENLTVSAKDLLYPLTWSDRTYVLLRFFEIKQISLEYLSSRDLTIFYTTFIDKNASTYFIKGLATLLKHGVIKKRHDTYRYYGVIIVRRLYYLEPYVTQLYNILKDVNFQTQKFRLGPSEKIVYKILLSKNHMLSVKEISKITGLSINNVRGILKSLYRKNIISRVKNKRIYKYYVLSS